MKFGCSIVYFSILQIWYVEVWISRSVLESPFDFEITRVNCVLKQEMCQSILSDIRGTVYYELSVLEISRADCNCQQNLNFFQHVNVTIALSSEEQLIHCIQSRNIGNEQELK